MKKIQRVKKLRLLGTYAIGPSEIAKLSDYVKTYLDYTNDKLRTLRTLIDDNYESIALDQGYMIIVLTGTKYTVYVEK